MLNTRQAMTDEGEVIAEGKAKAPLEPPIYDFVVKDLSGEDFQLSVYKGKVLLIVNVASLCGLTTQHYTELTELHTKYREKGLEILAFPCNQFGRLEQGDNEQIKEFVTTKFQAEFPVFDKVHVNGPQELPLFKYLKSQKGCGVLGDSIKWNFTKFLVDKSGVVLTSTLRATSLIFQLLQLRATTFLCSDCDPW
ncbi:probable phospholipid hydroperoxide glutathione peroxidase isoform X2 [Physcomitrium patens]|uniref:probable phospholipid hydroperoxide glutathione peroxidase isoform X2 n=1 Tax=Physcomitrium patens TaxID=3218 RepID=UPI003CCCEDF5